MDVIATNEGDSACVPSEQLRGLCTHCGLPPFVGDEYPKPYTGWSCIVCAAQTGPFE